MRGKRLFWWLHALFQHKKAAKKAPHQSVIVHGSSAEEIINNVTPTVTITEAELESSADSQALSAFFSKLPLEIRRLIYREVWRGYLEHRCVAPGSPGADMGLHIYGDGSICGSLAHTRCRTHPGAPLQQDPMGATPWPFDDEGDNGADSPAGEGNSTSAPHIPPRWFLVAWVMRLNWGRHWKCQQAVQQRWDPDTGYARPADRAPFLSLWLACKRMHIESRTSFFESVTLIFTSSLDAHTFFCRPPSSSLSMLRHLRSLELSFANPNDHLFLSSRVAVVASSTAAHTGRTSTTDGGDDDDDNDDDETITNVDPEPSLALANLHTQLFGPRMWTALVRGVREACPELRGLEVTIGGRMERGRVLGVFGGVEARSGASAGAGAGTRSSGGSGASGAETPSGESLGAGRSGSGSAGASAGPRRVRLKEADVWVPKGKVKVVFKMEGEAYVQEGGRMVRVAVEE